MKKDFLTAKTIRLLLAEEPGELHIPHVEVLSRQGLQLTLSVDTAVVSIE
jgi:hypothetical protein